MGKNSIFLWRFMAAFAVFFCHIFVANAIYVRPPDPDIQICKAGEYVSKCGDYYVGTNWLKGYTTTNINIITEGTDSIEHTYTQKTPDYFDYSTNANEVNMENLRKFFTFGDNLPNMYFTPNTGIKENQVENYAPSSEYKTYRDEILEKFCNPNYVTITCAPCPGSGKTAAASQFSNSWTSFNTIAHCYMTEYNDTTGTYINIDSKSDTSNEENECYFVIGANYVGGSVLGQSTSSDQSDNTTTIPAPSRIKKH